LVLRVAPTLIAVMGVFIAKRQLLGVIVRFIVPQMPNVPRDPFALRFHFRAFQAFA
jgi:hypothetical protein